ncbi:hypothetical protein F8M41_002785 [Gigaspora margarita]|uniref:Uncharacterized protein n=1 Tax=Gigaspora margarita TaxID=4874 RepID=A0A8H3XCB6_GIGMA|nr:hypothetical protein F8M41_002785 [Gigaspora margarita]
MDEKARKNFVPSLCLTYVPENGQDTHHQVFNHLFNHLLNHLFTSVQLPSAQLQSVQLPSVQLPFIQLPSVQLPSVRLPSVQLQLPSIQIPVTRSIKPTKTRKPKARKPKRTQRPPNVSFYIEKNKQPDWKETEEVIFQWEKLDDRMKLKYIQDHPMYIN